MIISFAWTTQALLDGRKTVTRRRWTEKTAWSLRISYRLGERIHQAWDKLPFAGGQRVGYVELTSEPYWEKLKDMPESDLEAEGGLWDSLGEFIELIGGDPDKEVLVIRFKWLGPWAGVASGRLSETAAGESMTRSHATLLPSGQIEGG